jgi:hypothetical protein
MPFSVFLTPFHICHVMYVVMIRYNEDVLDIVFTIHIVVAKKKVDHLLIIYSYAMP